MKTIALVACAMSLAQLQAQNVGIGTTTPVAKLEVRHASSVGSPTMSLYETSPAGYPRLQFRNAGSANYFEISAALNTGNDATSRLVFSRANGEELFAITGDGNVIANAFQYRSSKTFTYSISGADFRPVSGAESITVMNYAAGAYMNNGYAGMVAPVHLPQGATITSINVYFYDNSGVMDLQTTLYYGDNLSISGVMASVISTGTPGNSLTSTSSISNASIDNQNRYYYVKAQSSSGTWTDFTLRIAWVRINYMLGEIN